MVEIPDVRSIAEQIKQRIGHIEEQLRQHRNLNEELERLRGALARLEGEVSTRVRGARTAPSRHTRTATAKRSPTATRRRQPSNTTPRGQTRATILEALKDGPQTAGEISTATGIARGTASTTLTKLAKSGEVVKAERGYKLPE